ncbi:MAG: hypothetical protein KC656_13180, partial [Myxococcales bacterium]|nr:hypothetical protein [Myxococcales bacterium]
MLALVTLVWAADIPVGPTRPDTSIEDAIQGAGNGDVLVIDGGVYPTGLISYAGKDITFRAAGPDPVVVRATGGTLFRVNGGGLTLQDLTLDGQGTAQLVDLNNSDLTATSVVMQDGVSPDEGGLVDIRNGDVTLVGCTLQGGVAVTSGGLVHHDGGALTVTDTTLADGQAPVGSAVFASTGGTFGDIVVTGSSGGSGTLSCRSGGGCTVSGARFEGNAAVGGAAVRFEGAGAHVLEDAVVCSNSGTTVVEADGGTLALRRSFVFDNAAANGAVWLGSGGSVLDTHVVGNTSGAGSAGLRLDGVVDLRNTLVAWNEGQGPAVVATGALTAAYNLYFANATADSSQALGATEAVADPLLLGHVVGSCDVDQLRPYTNSPLVDQGDPALLDGDGSRSDIGAYESDDAVPFIDADNDGSPALLDCDDNDPDVRPGLEEVPCNLKDDDCDPATPDDSDDDSDGVSVCDGDCDDLEPLVAPGFTEALCTGLDEDCDPATPDDFDDDADGVSVCAADCDDADPDVAPGNDETQCNGKDDDCDLATPDDLDQDVD